MSERCPTEKLQEWGTLTPKTAAFPLLPGDQLTEATGRSTGLSGHLKYKYYFIYFLTLGSKHLQLYK